MDLYTDILPDHINEPGIHQSQLAEAISVWTWMQAGPHAQTVASVARAFNTTVQIIRDAIDILHPWIFVTGPDDDPEKQLIEHDGE